MKVTYDPEVDVLRIVLHNRELITRFEAKIQTTLARIRGEAE